MRLFRSRGQKPIFFCEFCLVTSFLSLHDDFGVSTRKGRPLFVSLFARRSVLTHDFFGNFLSDNSNVNGNPARCAWLVNAITMTALDRSLNTLWLITNTGLTSLLMTTHRIEFRPYNVTSQYSGHSSIFVESPSSANACLNLGSSLEHSMARRLLFILKSFSLTVS